jgi:hypothetical protein
LNDGTAERKAVEARSLYPGLNSREGRTRRIPRPERNLNHDGKTADTRGQGRGHQVVRLPGVIDITQAEHVAEFVQDDG